MKILVIGANSDISIELCKIFAYEKAEFYLFGRNKVNLESVKNELSIIGAKNIEIKNFDFLDYTTLTEEIDRAWSTSKGFDYVIVAYGILLQSKDFLNSSEHISKTIRTNTESPMIALTKIAENIMNQDFFSRLLVFGSVAGDRGRYSNYLYGASKASIHSFVEGLRARISKKNGSILLIKPGIVRTKMTANSSSPEFLISKPSIIAKKIYKYRKKNRSIYVPGYWRYILLVIRLIPSFIFLKLKI